jgi:hypothetical protein
MMTGREMVGREKLKLPTRTYAPPATREEAEVEESRERESIISNRSLYIVINRH